jgi:hypothetical protein
MVEEGKALCRDDLERLVKHAGRPALTGLSVDDLTHISREERAASILFADEWRAAKQIGDGAKRRRRLKALRERAVREARAALNKEPSCG